MRTEEEIKLKAKKIAEYQTIMYERFCEAMHEKNCLGALDAISREIRACGDKIDILSWVLGYLEQ